MIGSDYVEGLISKMRNIHKSTPPSFMRRENAAAILKAPPPGTLTKGPDRKFPGLHPPLGGATSPSLSTNRRFAFPILALLAALAVGLVFMLPGGLLQAQNDGTIEYAEDRKDAVATYTAADPEGAMTRWSLAGDDASDFMIDNGVLSFKEQPDFEDEADADTNNTYKVTVQATDETLNMGTKDVMVKVTNVDEDGTVTLSALGHQAGTELTATLTDPDGTISNQMWQWSRSATMGGALTDITDETSASYTPTSGDTGYYLVAKATYEDAEGDGKTAMNERSANAVQAVRTPNMAPVFPDDDATNDGNQTTRSVAENTPAGRTVGDPVKADPKDGDVLTYTLRDADGGTVGNSASFDIDRATGQIMTKGALNADA